MPHSLDEWLQLFRCVVGVYLASALFLLVFVLFTPRRK